MPLSWFQIYARNEQSRDSKSHLEELRISTAENKPQLVSEGRVIHLESSVVDGDAIGNHVGEELRQRISDREIIDREREAFDRFESKKLFSRVAEERSREIIGSWEIEEA